MSETKTTRATVELAKSDVGTWLNIEIGGRKASLCLERDPNGLRGPMVSDIFREWSESHFRPAGPAKRVLVLLSECLLAGTVTVILIGLIIGAVWLVYAHAGALAEGFGAALAAGLLGGAVRYFRTTRRLLHKLTFGRMFK
jgi:hypothetical protein